MSRATEIALFLVILQAGIGFVDSTGMFSQSYLAVPANNATYSISDLDKWSQESNKPAGVTDYLLLSFNLIVDGVFIGVKILFTVIFVYPTLVNTFGIPTILSVFLQTGIYFTYALWYIQFKSGRGFKTFE